MVIPEYDAHTSRKIGLFGEKKIRKALNKTKTEITSYVRT